MNQIDFIINRKSRLPLYYQLYEGIKRSIESGAWLPGYKLPTETEICKALGLSRNTVRQALQELKHEGYLDLVQGRGTFVAEKKLSYKFVTVISFTEELIARGITPTSRLISPVRAQPAGDQAEKLAIKEDSLVYCVERLRYGDGKLLGYNLSHIPVHLCPGLDKRNTEAGSLYALIEREYSLQVVRAERVMETTAANGNTADLLRIKRGFPVLEIRGIVYSPEGVPFDSCLEYYIG